MALFYRVVEVKFISGNSDYYPERLGFKGWKLIGSRPQATHTAAQGVIIAHKARKFNKTYYFLWVFLCHI